MLKRNVKIVAFGLLLGATLILPVTVRSQEAPPAAPPAAGGPVGPGPMMSGHGMGMQPHSGVQRVMRMLEHSKMMLARDTAKDVGGHKAEALKSIDAAIGHLKMAQEAEKK